MWRPTGCTDARPNSKVLSLGQVGRDEISHKHSARDVKQQTCFGSGLNHLGHSAFSRAALKLINMTPRLDPGAALEQTVVKDIPVLERLSCW